MTVPWYDLERERLGLLSPGERADLTGSAVDAARAALAEAPPAVRRLPDVLPADSGLPIPPRGQMAQTGQMKWWGGALGLASLAAGLLLVLLGRPGAGDRFKGGEVVLVVDRERAGAVTPDARTFRDGDQLQPRWTAPPGEHQVWVVVRQGGARVLEEGPLVVRGGNRVALPVGFVVDGGPLDVCVTWAPEGDSRQVCRALTPER